MAKVYRFKASIEELGDIFWREIEISSKATVAELGYTVMASFEGTASHLFHITHKGKRYEILFEEDDFSDFLGVATDPTEVRLEELELQRGSKLIMEYDYGAGWIFNIEITAIYDMQRGKGRHYPYIVKGNGRGIIEDIFPSGLEEIVKKTDETGECPIIYDYTSKRSLEWDYRDFELDVSNYFLKEEIERIKDAYEMIFEKRGMAMNQNYLELFEIWLQDAKLSEKTMRRHLLNADLYINDYLSNCRGIPMEEGVDEINLFLGDWFIRKCMWSSASSVKSTAASIKKFYKCMAEHGFIPEEDYQDLVEDIKDCMEDWQRAAESDFEWDF